MGACMRTYQEGNRRCGGLVGAEKGSNGGGGCSGRWRGRPVRAVRRSSSRVGPPPKSLLHVRRKRKEGNVGDEILEREPACAPLLTLISQSRG